MGCIAFYVSNLLYNHIIVHILATVNIKVFILDTFVKITKRRVHILDTLDRIMQLLKEQRKTQKQLMDYLGLGKTAFTGWKNGSNTSYKKHLDKIAEFFDVSADYLLGKTENRRPKTDKITEKDIKFALFGDSDVTDQMYDDVKDFVQYIKNKYKKD